MMRVRRNRTVFLNKRNKRVPLLIVSILAAVFLIVVGCSVSETVSFSTNTDYVFSVGEETCSVEEAKIILLQYQKEYVSLYGIDLWSTAEEQTERLEQYVKDLTVSELAEVYSLDLIAAQEEIVLTSVEQSSCATAAKAYVNGLSEEELAYLDVSTDTVAELFERYLLAQKVYEQLTEEVEEEVSDDEARVMVVMQICLSEEEDAEALYDKLEEGAEFATLCASYNESETDQLYVTRTTYEDAVTEVLFSLEEEAYSLIVYVDDCYTLFYCVDYFEETLTEENKDNVLLQRKATAVEDTFDAYAELLASALQTAVWSEVHVDTTLEVSAPSFSTVFDAYFGDAEE